MGADVLDTTEANALVSAHPNVHVARLPARGLKKGIETDRFAVLDAASVGFPCPLIAAIGGRSAFIAGRPFPLVCLQRRAAVGAGLLRYFHSLPHTSSWGQQASRHYDSQRS